jgi:hypothetical protein
MQTSNCLIPETFITIFVNKFNKCTIMSDNQTHSSPKQLVLQMVDRLPDDTNFDDILYHVHVMKEFEAGCKEADEGETFSQEEIMAEIK